ncbi:hypothetical protein [Flavobacterium crassostreae]|uniref:Uncharacterized protein n=1 Tax=Flavobacterium crassostreae TaxID=1763534 RepID=A0A1B9E7Z6_9FLAO|nr:hypothetical protein [Flavobacterium crassostreae]OCB78062.1 hypothetical protein LPBF_03675 [Flavobacterium crassostreae]
MNGIIPTKIKKSLLFGLVIFGFLLFSGSAFGQVQEQNTLWTTNGALVIEQEFQTETSKASKNMEFVLWFMGSSQKPHNPYSAPGTLSTKKQIISSGIYLNRLLTKAFLKKAVNHEIALT